jgi:hypothetical protein
LRKSYKTGSGEIRDSVEETPVDMSDAEVETVAQEEVHTVEEPSTTEQYAEERLEPGRTIEEHPTGADRVYQEDIPVERSRERSFSPPSREQLLNWVPFWGT